MTLILALNPPFPLTMWVTILSDSERAEILSESLQALLQTVNAFSVPSVIQIFNKDLKTYALTPKNNPS